MVEIGGKKVVEWLYSKTGRWHCRVLCFPVATLGHIGTTVESNQDIFPKDWNRNEHQKIWHGSFMLVRLSVSIASYTSPAFPQEKKTQTCWPCQLFKHVVKVTRSIYVDEDNDHVSCWKPVFQLFQHHIDHVGRHCNRKGRLGRPHSSSESLPMPADLGGELSFNSRSTEEIWAFARMMREPSLLTQQNRLGLGRPLRNVRLATSVSEPWVELSYLSREDSSQLGSSLLLKEECEY